MQRIILCLLIFIGCGVVPAQDSVPKGEPLPAASVPVPTVGQIIEKFIQALGGKTASDRLSSRVMKGRYEISLGFTGTIEVFAKAPNKALTVTVVPSTGEVRDGFDGATAWTQDNRKNVKEKAGAELATAKLESDFFRNIKLDQLYPSMRLAGVEKIGAREVYVIEAAPAEGAPEKLYFDVQSGLLLKRLTQRESLLGKLLVETFFEDYRDVDGVKIPFVLRRSTPAASITITYEEVKHNIPLDDAIFKKPSAR